MNPETVNTILDVMQRELEAEENRYDSVLNKANTSVTISGILLAAVSFLIHDFGDLLPSLALPILVISALCLFFSITISLFVIRTESFERIDFNVLAGELKQDSLEVKSRLIATYKEVLGKNSRIVGYRAMLVWWSALLIIAGVFLIISSILYLYLAGPKHL